MPVSILRGLLLLAALPALQLAQGSSDVAVADVVARAADADAAAIAAALERRQAHAQLRRQAGGRTCGSPAPSCANAGIEYARYANPAGDNAAGFTYAAYNPTVYKTQQPILDQGTITSAKFGWEDNQQPASPGDIKIYNQNLAFNRNYWTFNHRAYLVAPKTGNYLFKISYADDIGLVWTGNKAVSGWNRGNADIDAPYNRDGSYPDGGKGGRGNITVSLTQGQWFPFRVIGGQAASGFNLRFTIQDPDNVFLIRDAVLMDFTGYFKKFSCDGKSPAFPAFGAET